jgi:ATP-dependent protease ClpP protease subunit
MSLNYMKKKQIVRAEEDSDEEDETQMIKCEENRVYFHSDVDQKSCFKLIECLREAQKYVALQSVMNEFEDQGNIYLYIFSNGGELHASFNVADFILNSKVDIITVNEGCVSSAGTVISLAGKERFIRRNGYMLIHELRSGCLGKYSECQDDMENNDILMEHMKGYINDRCQNAKLAKKLDKVMKHDHIWDAEMCLKMGLVDKIV